MNSEHTPTTPDIKAALRRSYDANADERDEKGLIAFRAPMRLGFVERLHAESKTELLEIGAGAGHEAGFFVDSGLSVIAIDISSESVARCRAKGVDAEVGDFYDLAFPDSRFDAVWAASCLVHVPDRDLDVVLAEISRVLRPGGLLFVGLWGGDPGEGIWADDPYDPPRFYAVRTDEDAETRLAEWFTVVGFEALDPEPDAQGLHYQAAVLRRS